MTCIYSNCYHLLDHLKAPPMIWQFWFGICYCLPTPNCKCKEKNMAIPNGLAFWTWQLPSGPSQIFTRVFLSHGRVSSRVFPFARREAPPLAVATWMHTVPGGSSRYLDLIPAAAHVRSRVQGGTT
jgi:hypothetical protein